MRNSRTLVLEEEAMEGIRLIVNNKYKFQAQNTPPLDKSEPVNLFYRNKGKVDPIGKVRILRQRTYGKNNQHLTGYFRYLGRNKNGNTNRI